MKFLHEDFIEKDMKVFPKLQYRSIEKNYDKAKNVNESICKECRGFCCRECGCAFSPDDFKEVSFKSLKREIKKGYISIVYVDSYQAKQQTGVFILRMRNYGAPVVDMKDFGMGGCVLLTENGCPFSYEERPSGGKLLIPGENKDEFRWPECRNEYNLQQCCYEWLPHKKTLYRLYKYFKFRNIPCPKG